MKTILFSLALVACGSDPGPTTPSPDGGHTSDGSSGGGQRVVECSGRASSTAPSSCPHDDCDETSSTATVKCTLYASFIPGSSTGTCNSGQTGSYGLLFAKAPSDLASFFYEVVDCNAGTPTLHACASGFHTIADGPGGQPGYACN